MQPGYAHEMIYPGTGEYLPLISRNGALIADSQRGQNARIRMTGQPLHKTLADFLAQALYPVGRPIHDIIQAHVPRRFTHVPASPDVALQSPFLEIEAMRIDTSMGALEPHS